MDGRIALVPTLNIKDPEVHRLAADLARRRGTSMTAAVRAALEEEVARDQQATAARLTAVRDIARRSAARPEPFLDAADLYDDRGLPR